MRAWLQRKNQSTESPAYELPGSGFWRLNLREGTEAVSPGLAALLGAQFGVVNLYQITTYFDAKSAELIRSAVEELKSDSTIAPFLLRTPDEQHIFECRGTSFWPDAQALSPVEIVLWWVQVTGVQRSIQQLAIENETLKREARVVSNLLNVAPFPVWQRDETLGIHYYNLSYGEIAEEADERASDRGMPELDSKARALARLAWQSGEAKTERRHIVVGGQRRLFQLSEIPIPGERVLAGYAQDVTEIEQLQDELQRHISAQSDLLESSASAMAIYGADTRLVTFNFAFARLWKLDESWLDTEPTYGEILEALRERRKLPEQANFPIFKQQQMKLFTDLLEPREEFFYLPDGKAVRVIVIPHALGGLMFAYEDVTDRLALERSYNTLIAVQRETLDNLHEAVALFGEDGRLKLSNPGFAKLWNMEKELAEREPHLSEWIEVCKPLFLYTEWENYKHGITHQIQQRQNSAYRMERADGKTLAWSTIPLPDGATLVTFIDITDSTLLERSLREKNEALQEADKLKTEFLANVSYELRSPLTSITGFSEMLRQEYFGNLSEKQKEYVEGIHASSEHLMQLVNDILDLASIEAGYMRLEVSRFEVYPMMQAMNLLVHERVRELNLTVDLTCAENIGTLLADETRIRQILFQLLSNAIKFSPTGSTITFSAQAMEGELLCFTVADQGSGIPLEEQQAVFSKFYKGSSSPAAHASSKGKQTRKTGTGLGLSIVKNFIELHGGHVEIESAPQKGTAIRCILPRENPDLQPFLKTKRTRARGKENGA